MPPENRGPPIRFTQSDGEPVEDAPFDPYDMDSDEGEEYDVNDLLTGLTRVQQFLQTQGGLMDLRDMQFLNADGSPFDPGPAVEVFGEPVLRVPADESEGDRTSEESVSSDGSDLFDVYNAAVDAAGGMWSTAERNSLDLLEGFDEPPSIFYVEQHRRAAEWKQAMQSYLDKHVAEGLFKPVNSQDFDNGKPAKKICFHATTLEWVFRYRKSSEPEGKEVFKVALADQSCRGLCYDTMMTHPLKKSMLNAGLVCSYLAQQYGLTMYQFDLDVVPSQEPLDLFVEVLSSDRSESKGTIYKISRNIIPGLVERPTADTDGIVKLVAGLGFKSDNGELFTKQDISKDAHPTFLHVSVTNLFLVAHPTALSSLKDKIINAVPGSTFLGPAKDFAGWDILQTSSRVFLGSNKKLDSVLDSTALDTDRKKYMRTRSVRSPRIAAFLAAASTAASSLAADIRPDLVCRATRLQNTRALRTQGKIYEMLYRYMVKTSDMCMQLERPKKPLHEAHLICYVSTHKSLVGTAIFLDEYPLYWQADIVDESSTKESIAESVANFYSALVSSWNQGEPACKQVRSDESMGPLKGWEAVDVHVSENPAHLLVSNPNTEGFEQYQRLFKLDA